MDVATDLTITQAIDLFPPEMRTAAIIPRWSVVFTLNRDTVSNHSFFVVFYARQVARLIGWKGDLGQLMYLALIHDLDEAVTGDIVSPVKKEILDPKRYRDYIKRKMEERFPGLIPELRLLEESAANEAMAIVKVADRMDGLFFLLAERRMGNTVVSTRIDSATTMLHDAWEKLPGDKEKLRSTYRQVIDLVVHRHAHEGGFGV